MPYSPILRWSMPDFFAAPESPLFERQRICKICLSAHFHSDLTSNPNNKPSVFQTFCLPKSQALLAEHQLKFRSRKQCKPHTPRSYSSSAEPTFQRDSRASPITSSRPLSNTQTTEIQTTLLPRSCSFWPKIVQPEIRSLYVPSWSNRIPPDDFRSASFSDTLIYEIETMNHHDAALQFTIKNEGRWGEWNIAERVLET